MGNRLRRWLPPTYITRIQVLRGVGELCALHAGAHGSPAAGTEAAAVAAAAAAAAAGSSSYSSCCSSPVKGGGGNGQPPWGSRRTLF